MSFQRRSTISPCRNLQFESNFSFSPISCMSKNVPVLSPEQLLKRRNAVFAYYNELSKRNTINSPNVRSPSGDRASRRDDNFENKFLQRKEKHLEANDIPRTHANTRKSQISTAKSPKIQFLPKVRRTTSVPCRIDTKLELLPTLCEEPAKETWEEIRMLTLKLANMNTISIPREEIREHVRIISQLECNNSIIEK